MSSPQSKKAFAKPRKILFAFPSSRVLFLLPLSQNMVLLAFTSNLPLTDLEYWPEVPFAQLSKWPVSLILLEKFSVQIIKQTMSTLPSKLFKKFVVLSK